VTLVATLEVEMNKSCCSLPSVIRRVGQWLKHDDPLGRIVQSEMAVPRSILTPAWSMEIGMLFDP
jgi:hypothetical protein